MSASKLICLDLDGTLYNSEHKVSEANAKAVSRLSEEGHHICLCSGRGPTMYVPTARELGVRDGCLYMVGYNGAVVYRLGEDGDIQETLFETLMTDDQVHKIVNRAKDSNLAVEMDIGDRLYACVPTNDNDDNEERPRKLLQNHAQLCGSRPQIVLSLAGRHPNKISVLTSNPQGFVEKCHADPGFNDDDDDDGIDIVQGGPYWCETVNTTHDKAMGIRLVLNALGSCYTGDDGALTLADCIYFGDGANDATSLQACGLGIAMKGSKPEAMKAANKISQWTNDEDAVAKELEIILFPTTK